MKRNIILLIIGIAISVVVWFVLSTKNTIDKLKYSFSAKNPKLSITNGLELDIIVALTNPTTTGISVTNVTATAQLNGKNAGSIKPGIYKVDIKPNQVSTLTLPYNVGLIDLGSILVVNIVDIFGGGEGIINNLKNKLKESKLNIKGTIDALKLTVPFNENIDLGNMF